MEEDHILDIEPRFMLTLGGKPVTLGALYAVENKWFNYYSNQTEYVIYPRINALQKVDISDVPRNDNGEIILKVKGGFFTFTAVGNEAYLAVSGTVDIGLILGANGISEEITSLNFKIY